MSLGGRVSLQHLLHINRERSQPLYQQIAEQIKMQISDGRLPIGTRLPTVRQLANTLGVTRLTVHSAYSELQSGGWVEATVGRGTFVAASAQPEGLMTAAGRNLTPDGVLDDMRRITQMIGLRSLAYADPDPMLYPMREFWDSMLSLRNDPSMFQYGSPQGDPVLRVEMAALLGEQGIEATPDEILITSGVTQGLALVCQALAHRGDVVAVEQPTYLGLLHILQMHGIQAAGVPLDADGVQLEALERVIVEQKPRFFYTISRFHNPTGLCPSLERRRALLALAARYRLTLVEDDIYGLLSYDGPPPPPLKALDSENSVIHLTSMSKVLLPGIRVGSVIAPRPIHEQMLPLRRANDLVGAQLMQRTVADFLRRGRLKVHVRRMLPIYRERRDALLRALSYWMPDGVEWTQPAGGFCCWLTLPGNEALDDLYAAALSRGMVFTPGEVFLAEPDDCKHLRLCYANQSPDTIRESVVVLAELIRERIGHGAHWSKRDWVPLV
jgi:DNA-binding transcriptional MocR family regulator